MPSSASAPLPSAVAMSAVRFAYAPGPPVLSIDSLIIPSGRRIFLHGPSGSGKTTLLGLISGVLVAQSGTVSVLGNDLSRLSPAARDRLRGARMGYIFQGFNLIPYLTVAENIALPCRLHPARKARIQSPTLEAEVARIARRLDIANHLTSRVTRLSTGQQQRVAIARAVIGAPSLIIADEPTSALDTDRRDAFLDLLLEMTGEAASPHAEPTTLLFVSHDRSLAPHFDETISLGALTSNLGAARP